MVDNSPDTLHTKTSEENNNENYSSRDTTKLYLEATSIATKTSMEPSLKNSQCLLLSAEAYQGGIVVAREYVGAAGFRFSKHGSQSLALLG